MGFQNTKDWVEYRIKTHTSGIYSYYWDGIWINHNIFQLENKSISLWYYVDESKWYIKEIKKPKINYVTINSIKGLTGKSLYQLDYVKDRNETITN